MKKLLCVALAALLCALGALAEGGAFTLRFEEGFSLTLPEGWVSYPVDDPTIRYALGDGEGHYMYIQFEPTDCADFDAMRAAIEARDDCGKTSPLTLDGQAFAAFISPDMNASGCSTLLGGALVTFLFTPQNDAEYMAVVAEIMAGFRALE